MERGSSTIIHPEAEDEQPVPVTIVEDSNLVPVSHVVLPPVEAPAPAPAMVVLLRRILNHQVQIVKVIVLVFFSFVVGFVFGLALVLELLPRGK
ncbi:hypothetical protein TIFTF001_041216 [Ficus carica]|uniref:Uncharacterized protein n=1 Tax=Ficus carica TaxID=3494 RepID=A0AA87ZA77_FICCA|nr:hypothetical protein TIFTF001_041216 [Ficus carica]